MGIEIGKVGIDQVGIDQVGIKLEHNSTAENSQIPSYPWNKISLALFPCRLSPCPNEKLKHLYFLLGQLLRGEPGNKVNILLAFAILCIHALPKLHKVS